MRRRGPARSRVPAHRGAVSAWIVLTCIAASGGTHAAPAPSACAFAPAVSAAPGAGGTPLLVQFNATVSTGTPTAYEWSFGDGSYWNASGAGASTPFHRYAAPGSYLVSVTVVELGCGAVASTTVLVTPGPLSVLITASPTRGPAPLLVRFNVSIAGGTGTYVAVNWTFGDGGAGVGIGLQYLYERAGTFVATVAVEDSDHQVGNASVAVSVTAPASAGLDGSFWVVVGLGGGGAFVLVLGLARARRPRTPSVADPPTLSVGPRSIPAGSGPVTEVITPPSGDGASRDAAPSTVQPDPPSRRKVEPPVAERRQLSRSVLIHVGAQGRLGSDEVAPPGLTQAGMAQALGVGQNSLTNVLRRLVAAGVLTQDVRHVRGQPRRLRVYRLTTRGEALYQDVRRRRAPSDEPSGPRP